MTEVSFKLAGFSCAITVSDHPGLLKRLNDKIDEMARPYKGGILTAHDISPTLSAITQIARGLGMAVKEPARVVL